MSLRVVLDDGQDIDVGVRACEDRRDHRAVRLVDLTGGELVSGGTQLAARCDHGHPRAPRACELGDTRGGQGSDLCGSEASAGRDDGRAGADVSATWSHVLTGNSCAGDHDAAPEVFGDLDRDHGIRLGRHRAARRDPGGRTRRKWPGRRRPRSDAVGDRKLAGCLRRTDREAVHRRARKRRKLDAAPSPAHARCVRSPRRRRRVPRAGALSSRRCGASASSIVSSSGTSVCQRPDAGGGGGLDVEDSVSTVSVAPAKGRNPARTRRA